MKITKASKQQYEAVRAFYHSLIDGMENSPYTPGWKKDIYPAPEFLRESIATGELFIGLLGESIAAVMVLNHECNKGYQGAQWRIEANDSEILFVHALGVHPDFCGKGYAKALVRKAVSLAEESGMKAVRLDVLRGNIPAERLYSGMGFRYIDTLRMYYEDTGWTDYELYEYVLQP